MPYAGCFPISHWDATVYACLPTRQCEHQTSRGLVNHCLVLGVQLEEREDFLEEVTPELVCEG